MAARKKGPGTGGSDAEASRATAVILEQIHGQFKAFGEGLTTLREHMDRRFEQMDVRFGRVEQDLTLVKDAVTEHGRQLRDVHGQLRDMREQLRDVRVKLGDLRVAVDKKVDRNDVEGVVERAVARAVDR